MDVLLGALIIGAAILLAIFICIGIGKLRDVDVD